MAKKALCRAELEVWLRAVGAKRVNIAYAREEKGDPRLPSFKPDRRKQHDAQIRARYLAQSLSKDGYDAVVTVPK